MDLTIKSQTFPFILKISGNISQADYEWRIRPILEEVNSFDLDFVLSKIKSIKEWSRERGQRFRIKANFFFKVVFFLFNKSH